MNHLSTAFRDFASTGANTCQRSQPLRSVAKNKFAMASVMLVLAGAALLSGCEPQNVREQSVKPSASEAALNAVMVEPGPPPPDMASPSDAVILERLRLRASARREQAARLRLDTEVNRGFVDVWAHIRSGMRFPEVNHPAVEAELAWYAKRPGYIQRTTDRARLYLGYIVHEAKRRNLPLELTLLPIVESAFQPYARSSAGAMGIWQFIRSTGRYYGLKQTSWSDARRDIVRATRAAFDYLEKLHKDMDGDWLLAVAAYNAGEGNVLRAVRKNRARGKPTDFFSLSLPAETRAYVPRLLAFSKLVARPADYDIELDQIDDKPYFQLVDTGGRLNLAKAAEMAGITLNELMLLNPALVRDSTDPRGPHSLALPVESVAAFRNALAATPKEQRVPWSPVKVAGGDTLSTIAERHAVTVNQLREANDLRSDTIRIGQQLRIPGRQAVSTANSIASATVQQLSPEVRRGREQARRNEQRTIYRVRNGDSLWSIAGKYKVSVGRLRQWNGLSKRKVLRPGQKLVIWRSGSAIKASSKSRSSPKNARIHLVRSGDNLWSIAKRYQLRTADLARWNDIKTTDTLRPGQKLRLKAPDAA
ncbi:MAG: membrane-bound lytic murein transglycosylase D [Gammaproteobacteria bacterium]|jgi:membrane-bound lytic murein transglycosylase D